MALKLITNITLSVLVILWIINRVHCFSMESQKVDLHDTRTFVISSYDGEYDEDESEMIQPKDIEHIESLAEDEEKYRPLHSYVAQYKQLTAQPIIQSIRDLSKFVGNSIRIRTLKFITDSKRRKSKSLKREDSDAYEEEEEEDAHLTTVKQNSEFLDGMNRENETIWEEASTTEFEKSTTENINDSEITSEEFESTPPHSTHSTSRVSLISSTHAPKTSDYDKDITTAITRQKTQYTETTERQDETSENVSTTETIPTVSTKIHDSKKKTTNTLTTEYATTITDNNTIHSTEKVTMTHNDKSITSNMTVYEEESTTASYKKSTETTTEIITDTNNENSTTISDIESTEATTEKKSHTNAEENTTISDKKSATMSTEKKIKFITTEIVPNHTEENHTIKSTISEEETETPKSMDYEKIMPEYSAEIEELNSENFTYNFTDDEIEKSLKNLVKKTFDLKKPSNCSQFDGSQYGIKAVKCAIEDFQHAKNRTEVKKVFRKAWKIFKVWLCIYVCIAIPCWCQKGWCCCCFRCKICFPRTIIFHEKRYFSKNPPGVLAEPTPKSKQKSPSPDVKYEPTLFEEDAYEQFEAEIRNL